MLGRFLYDSTVEIVGTILGLAIFVGWALWHKRGTVALLFALGTAVGLALSGCAAGKIALDAARDGVIR